MKALLLRTALVSASLAASVFAADETTTSARMKEILKAQLAADAKNQSAKPAPTAPVTAAKPEVPAEPAAPTSAPATAPTKKAAAAASVTAAQKQAPTVLPKVEVRKDRVTVLDHQLQEQEKEIAREQKNTKPTELDKALNGSKVSTTLSALGGDSAQHRATIAKERVSLMEDEKDLIEAIAHARTKEEKQKLQKELDELKAMRRDLEKSLR
ncbi:MAG: hypothetical protein EXS32_02995 [Opitutus sp.]|nr:hypothetical protein [Opitutus sp.]